MSNNISSSVLKSSIRGRRIYENTYNIDMYATTIIDLFNAPTIMKRSWHLNNTIKSLMHLMEDYFAKYEVVSYEMHAEETEYVSELQASLVINSLAATTIEGDIIEFDLKIINNYFVDDVYE